MFCTFRRDFSNFQFFLDVCFQFLLRYHLLNGLELRVPPGQWVAVNQAQQRRASGPGSQLLLLAFAVSTEQQRQRGNSQLSYS